VAIFHLSVKTISRSAGRSATAAIAYRSGERIMDERTGLIHDYTRRNGIEHTEIFLPENSPAWAGNRAQLWNAAEQAETRKNSTVAREFEIAMPAELGKAQRLELVREFARELVQRHSMAVDVAIHEPGKEGDNRNHHAHILCSTRRLTPEGFKDKTRELDDQKSGEVVHWRERWAQISNHHLENAGRQERVDHRSLGAQQLAAVERGDVDQAAKLDRVPTIHLGPNVVQMERRGIRTERGDLSRDVATRNAKIIDLAEARNRIAALRADHERNDRNRADTQQTGRDTGKPNIGRVGRVPPPFARGRLRSLSELGVVRFAERGEVLLPSDVSRNVEHQRAEPDNALRRRNDGLSEKPASTREAIQREVNATTLRELVKQREGEQWPTQAANDATPEKIKAEWQAEKARQFTLVVNKAQRIQARTAGQVERQEGKLFTHDQARPKEPAGLFAGFKKAAHDQALTAWQGVRAGLEKRFNQLRTRLNVIGDYLRKAGPYELATKGERLAEQRAAKARPELAETYQQIIEKEKAAAIAAQRAKIEQRRTGKIQDRAMKQETIEELKQRTDANREKADQAERAELEKAGRLAAIQSPLDAGTDKGEQDSEARKRAILEGFKEKVQKDRDNERGRGR
jgi:hypothetical protein